MAAAFHVRITATTPPAITSEWSVNPERLRLAFVTSRTALQHDCLGGGTGGDQRLHGYDGDTGAVVYAARQTN